MKQRWQIFWHSLFWVAFLLLIMFVAMGQAKYSATDVLVIFVLYPAINISLFYLHYLVLIPQFLDKKKYSYYILSVLVAIAVYSLIKYGFANIFKEVVLMRERKHPLSL